MDADIKRAVVIICHGELSWQDNLRHTLNAPGRISNSYQKSITLHYPAANSFHPNKQKPTLFR